MSDLIDEPREGLNEPEFSVSEISGAIKRAIESGFSHVRIRGEVGRVSMPRSGHIYLDLKDDKSVISAVVWKGVAGRLATHPEEGLEVVATGRITTFGGQSKYQLVIEDMKPAGVGALMAMLEKRKVALQAEGLFDPALKVDLPYLPEVIGVITSPSGAVIRDILHRLRDRFPRKVLIWPVAVQGKNCAPEVTRAIEGFNAMSLGGAMPRPDLLIVARGGGSLEDLWGFNEENVARAAAASQIPLISAVGHETDTTLIDFVSDVRAPTPTAAAELAVPVRHELLASVAASEARMAQSVSNLLSMRQQRLRDLGRALPRPDTLLDGPRQKLDLWGDRLPAGLIKLVQGYRLLVSERAGSLRPALLRRAVIAEDKRLQVLAPRLAPGLIRVVGAKREALGHRSDRLNVTPLQQDMSRKLKELSRLAGRSSDAGARQIGNWKEQIAALDRLRETLGYKATLRRGYAVVHGDGAVVTSKKAAGAATKLEVEFADGRLQLSGRPVRRGAAPGPETGTADQGDLF